jgi:hypothetical protein
MQFFLISATDEAVGIGLATHCALVDFLGDATLLVANVAPWASVKLIGIAPIGG